MAPLFQDGLYKIGYGQTSGIGPNPAGDPSALVVQAFDNPSVLQNGVFRIESTGRGQNTFNIYLIFQQPGAAQPVECALGGTNNILTGNANTTIANIEPWYIFEGNDGTVTIRSATSGDYWLNPPQGASEIAVKTPSISDFTTYAFWSLSYLGDLITSNSFFVSNTNGYYLQGGSSGPGGIEVVSTTNQNLWAFSATKTDYLFSVSLSGAAAIVGSGLLYLSQKGSQTWGLVPVAKEKCYLIVDKDGFWTLPKSNKTGSQVTVTPTADAEQSVWTIG